MKAIATKQPTNESVKQNKSGEKGRSRSVSPLSTGMALLQRKCACGGGCPRCQDELGIQTKLKIGEPGDKYEQEADRIADEVMRMPEPSVQRQIEPEEDEEMVQRKVSANPTSLNSEQSSSEISPIVHEVLNSPGQPLDPETQTFMESRFGHDFSQVRVHTNAKAADSTQAVNARAYTAGQNIVFGREQYAPGSSKGQGLLAHELTHVVQQGGASKLKGREGMAGDNDVVISGRQDVFVVQRDAKRSETEEDVTRPLTEREWQQLELWLSYGKIGIEPLTHDPVHNAEVVATSLFCSRIITSLILNDTGEDPLLCIDSDVTKADPRVQQIVPHVTARGPIINWTRVAPNQRMLDVMELLVNRYQYPVNGAAGLVGNLWAESGVLPNRIQGSHIETPMTASNFAGQMIDFTAEEVMNRQARQGPQSPGIGLAQWTSEPRRAGLFQHQFQGTAGAAILFKMDAQVDYLVNELQTRYRAVNQILMRPGVLVNDASDEVVYRFEVPKAILDENNNLLPRNHPKVQGVFARRRAFAQKALRVFREANPE